MSVLEMSVSGAALIAVVIVIRAIGMYRLPKRTFTALWGVALCRLLIPFSVPARFSVFPFLARIGRLAETPAALSNPIPVPIFQPRTDGAAWLNVLPNAAEAPSAHGIALSPLMTVWLTGTLILAVFFAVSYFRCRRKLEQAAAVDACLTDMRLRTRGPGLERAVSVRLSDRIASPVTYGLARPVILLPGGMDWADKPALEYVLAHEMVHIERFDQLKKLLAAAALCVHWFNPLVWAMYFLFNRDIEIACDESVVKAFGEPRKSDYARVLIGMEERKTRFAPLYSGFSKYSIEERIGAIMKIRKTTVGALLLAFALVLGTVAVFATSGAKDVRAGEAEVAGIAGAAVTADEGEPADPETVAADEEKIFTITVLKGQDTTEGEQDDSETATADEEKTYNITVLKGQDTTEGEPDDSKTVTADEEKTFNITVLKEQDTTEGESADSAETITADEEKTFTITVLKGQDTTYLDMMYNLMDPSWWKNSEWAAINENTYYLEYPVELNGGGNLWGIVFSDKGLQIEFGGTRVPGVEQAVTAADGAVYVPGEVSDDFVTYMRREEKDGSIVYTYDFSPTPEITLRFGDSSYEIQLTRVPREFLERHALTE